MEGRACTQDGLSAARWMGEGARSRAGVNARQGGRHVNPGVEWVSEGGGASSAGVVKAEYYTAQGAASNCSTGSAR